MRIWLGLTALSVAAAGWLAGASLALTVLVIGAMILLVVMWLPRAGHRAFEAGRFNRAQSLFRISGWSRWTRLASYSAALSINACALGRGDFEQALTTIKLLGDVELAPDQRAIWCNNVAYALARLEREGSRALELADQALAARPFQRGFIHTRGIVLLSIGLVDEAIGALDKARGDDQQTGNLTLESERCFDIARAWLAKGEIDYACDYFDRCRLASPSSRWAKLAGIELLAHGGSRSVVPTSGIV